VILAYLGHAYWVFRGKVTAAYGEAAGEPRIKAKSGHGPANVLITNWQLRIDKAGALVPV
jgi:hypothetical protein